MQFNSRRSNGNQRRVSKRITLEQLEDRRMLVGDPLVDLHDLGMHVTPLDLDGNLIEPEDHHRGGLDYGEVFNLQSKPGSDYTIYLDFDGHITENTSWNSSYGIDSIESPPFDLDGDPTTFSQLELNRILVSWQRTAEDYAPFDVNVTTRDPGLDALSNNGGGDTTWGARAIVTDDTFAACGCGGFAFLNTFDVDDTPTFVFNHGPGSLGETFSHEVGHMVGLNHDGDSNGQYYFGHGAGETSWGAIMGAPFDENITQWSRGNYFDSSNSENDLSTITTQNGFGYRADDYGNSIGTASALNVANGTTVNEFGIIDRNTDVDYFSFVTGAGPISISVDPLGGRPNLDAFVAVYDSNGGLVAFDIPQGEVAASIENVDVSAGTYYVRVEGVGSHDSFNTATNQVDEPSPQPWNSSSPEGYSDYGSMGQYRVSGSIVAPTTNLIGIQATTAEQVEGNAGETTPLTFTVTRSGDTSSAASVDYSMIANLPDFVGDTYETQAASNDFVAGTSLSGTVEFAAGETSQSIVLNVLGDDVSEDDEYFDLVLSNQTDGWEMSDSRATGIILSDEGMIEFNPIGKQDSVFEGPFDGALVRFRQLGAANGEFDEWALDNVSLAGSDWVDDFEPGVDNAVWSEITNGTVNTQFGGAGGRSLFFSGAPDRTAVSNFQNAQPGDILSFDIIFGDSTNGGENVDEGEDVVIEYSLDGGSNWQLVETVDSQTNKVWTSIDVALPAGIDTNPLSEVSFEIVRQGGLALPSTVNWEVVAESADASDFIGNTLPSGQITFGGGESTATVTVQVSPDAMGESDETFGVLLTSASSDGLVTLGTSTRATGTILNDDVGYVINAGPQVRWRQLDNSDGDFDNWGIDNVELTSGEFGDDFDPDIDSGEWVEISGGTAENDFNGSDGNALYFTGGNSRFATSRFISPDVGDMLSFDIIYGSDVNGGENPEDGEEVVLEYSFDGSSWDQLAQYPLSITSWSTRQVAIPGGADVDQIEGDSGTTDFTFTVSRQGVTAFPSTIDWEITGSGASPANAADFVGGVLPSGSLSFSAGEVQKSITVQVSGDSQFEADETFDLVLADAGIMETATIINDDEASNSGDFDGDGFYACSDVDALVQAIAGQTAGGMQFDLSGDGSLTNEDLELWLAEAGAANLASGNPYLHGDANLDGAVDVQDFNVWNANKFTTGTGWCSADFNADGVVDVLDFNSWNANKFQSADSAVSSVSDQPVIVMSNVASVSRPEVKRYDVRAAVFADYDVNA